MTRKTKLQFVTLLTVARLPLVLLFFVGAIIHTMPRYHKVAPGLFLLAFGSLILSAVTDLFDGYFARKFKVVTPFGAHADPLMDKFFYLASLPLLVFVTLRQGHTTHSTILLILTLLFLARDQWVTFLRSIGAIYKVSGGANWSGKVRTAMNFPIICGIYYFEEAPDHWQFIPEWLVYTAEVAALFMTVLTMFIYSRRYWPYLKRAASVDPSSSDK